MNKKAVIYWFSGTGNTEKVAREYKKNFEEHQNEINKFFNQRKWMKSGLSWILDSDCVRKGMTNSETDWILVERSENAIAMLDCRDGYFYFWEKALCDLKVKRVKK